MTSQSMSAGPAAAGARAGAARGAVAAGVLEAANVAAVAFAGVKEAGAALCADGAGLCAGTGVGGFAAVAEVAAGAGAAFAGAAPAASASIVAICVPCFTRSPTLTFTAVITPAAGEGTSIVALSDSSVTSESSAATRSPTLMKTSMTGTSV